MSKQNTITVYKVQEFTKPFSYDEALQPEANWISPRWNDLWKNYKTEKGALNAIKRHCKKFNQSEDSFRVHAIQEAID